MYERFKPTTSEESIADLLKRARIHKVDLAIREGEAVFRGEGREEGKKYLPKMYDNLIAANKRDKEIDWNTLFVWNPQGDLAQPDFEELNLRRKKLSNDIGIMTASGVVRHDLNKI